jgi:hypothetical protein
MHAIFLFLILLTSSVAMAQEVKWELNFFGGGGGGLKINPAPMEEKTFEHNNLKCKLGAESNVGDPSKIFSKNRTVKCTAPDGHTSVSLTTKCTTFIRGNAVKSDYRIDEVTFTYLAPIPSFLMINLECNFGM